MLGSMVCFTEPKSVITVILCTGGQTKNCRSEKPNGMWVTAREPRKLSVVQTVSIRSRSPTNEVIKVISGAAPRNRCHRPTWESSFRKILFHLTFLCCPQERSVTIVLSSQRTMLFSHWLENTSCGILSYTALGVK